MSSQKKHILVIGATGFTGKQVLKQLLARDDVQITCMIRKGTTAPMVETGHYNIVRGDLDNQTDIETALAGKDGLIYVASLGFGHADNVVKACENAKINKAVFTSTTALLTKLNANSKTVRLAAEKSITHSKISNWTIIRPTMIYGLKGDRNMERLVRALQKWPFFVIPGKGLALQQPNHVSDVASALIQAYFSSNTQNKTYNISGDKPLTFKECVQQVSQALGKKTYVVHIPFKPCFWALSILEKLFKNPRIKAEQLLRLDENKAFDHNAAKKDFNFQPKSFKKGIEELILDINKESYD